MVVFLVLCTSYGVYISQLIRFARSSSYVADANTCNKLLTQKLLKQGDRYHKLRQKLFSKPEFNGTLVYKLKKIVGTNNVSAQFIKIISNYKKIGYNINVLRQAACLWSTKSRLTTLLFSLIAWRRVVPQTL